MDVTQKSSNLLAWQLVYKNWPGLFFVLDMNLKILAGSKDILAILQLSEKEIIGKSINHVYAILDETAIIDDLKWRLSLEYIQYTGESHKMNPRKVLLWDHDGNKIETYWRPENLPVYDDEDKLVYIIHQLKEVDREVKDQPQNARTSNIAKNINDGIYEIDFRGNTVTWNDHLYGILGYNIGEVDLDLLKMLRIIHPDDRRMVRDLIREKKHYAPGFEIEFRLKTKAGTYIDVLSKGIISRSKKGEPINLTATIHDISSYKEQERVKAQLELITNTIPAMIFYVDNQLRFQFVNPAYLNLIGKRVDEVVGKHVLEIVGHEVYHRLLPNALNALEGKKSEVETVTEIDGKSRFLKTWYSPDEVNHTIRGFIGLTMDITEEKTREIALNSATKEKQKLLDQLSLAHKKISRDKDVLKNFFMKAPAIIAIHEGPDYVIKYLNQKATQLYGNHIGKPLREITSAGRYRKIVNLFDQAYHQQKEITVKEFKLAVFPGRKKPPDTQMEVIFLDLVVQPTLDAHDKPDGIILYANDVTRVVLAKRAMQESAEKNRLLLEAMPIITCTYDTEGILEYVNSEWYEYTGLEKGGSLHENLKKALHPEDVDKNELVWAECLENGCIYDEYLRIKDRDGNFKWHHHRVVPIQDEDGTILRWVGSATDIDEEVRANEIKDQFIGIASHELKTPLTSVKAYIQLVQEQCNEAHREPITTYLNKALKNTERLHGLISELLDVSRIQSGKMDLNIEPFNLDEMVREVIDSNQCAVETHKIIMRGQTGLIIKADKKRIEQIINNLLSNAIKYSPGKNEVLVLISKTDNHVLIDVTDYGIGILKHEQKKLFEQFYRVKNVSKTASGLGIGLYISLAIAKAHGGRITVRSEEGQGSTFTLVLPLY